MLHDARMIEPRGRVEVIAGPMFAGKTEELLRRVRRAAIAGQRVVVISHSLDTRAGANRVASHAGLDAPSRAVGSAEEIPAALGSAELDIVAIDEAQFFGPPLLDVVRALAAHGLHVIVAGLDVTFLGEPFEPLPSLMAGAERVDKLTAVCSVCGADAIFHARVAPADTADVNLVTENVGGRETYQALCRRHFSPEPPSESSRPTE
jgi:thymidine kinase